MKKHLNTLYVTTQGAYLSKEGETVVVKVDGDVRLRLPVHTISAASSASATWDAARILWGSAPKNRWA